MYIYIYAMCMHLDEGRVYVSMCHRDVVCCRLLVVVVVCV